MALARVPDSVSCHVAEATRGEGIVNGHSVTRDPMAVRHSVGYMPDNFGVYDGMKVWEFLDFFAVAYRIGGASESESSATCSNCLIWRTNATTL